MTDGLLPLHRLPSRRRRVALAAALLAFATPPVPALAQEPPATSGGEYRLGTMDKLRVKVVEWQTAEGTVRDWTAIGGDYLVGPSGAVSLPFIGEVPAAGKTTAEVAATIGENLQQTLGLLDMPNASVELAEFRPVFVAGDAETPGRYPYDPDLTVLKAVSLAGGLRRADVSQRLERDIINARGDENVLVADRNRLFVKRARLAAEADGSLDFDAPPEVKDAPDIDMLMADETSIMTTRDKRLRLQLEAIEDLKRLLESEIISLEKKIVSQNRQIELTKEEQAGIGNLQTQGLVVNSRVLSIERTIAELESEVLDFETAMLRARQDIAKANQDAVDLANDREAEIAQQRQDVEAQLKAADLKIQMSRSLVGEALARAPEAAMGTLGGADIAYSIVREADGESREIEADENTRVLPGDVVKVALVPTPVN